MSFFSKLKQFVGAGTVKVDLAVPPQVQKAGAQFAGSVLLNAVSDQHVLEVTVKLTEHWSTGRGDEKTEKEYELGKVAVAGAFDMKQGEQRNLEFVLPFTLLKSGNDVLKEKGGALGMLGKAAAFVSAEASTYKVTATADVKGAALDPTASKPIRLV
jgi:hypothetical protein